MAKPPGSRCLLDTFKIFWGDKDALETIVGEYPFR